LVRTIQDYLGHRDPKHAVTRIAGPVQEACERFDFSCGAKDFFNG
jgi:hypothetical protein